MIGKWKILHRKSITFLYHHLLSNVHRLKYDTIRVLLLNEEEKFILIRHVVQCFYLNRRKANNQKIKISVPFFYEMICLFSAIGETRHNFSIKQQTISSHQMKFHLVNEKLSKKISREGVRCFCCNFYVACNEIFGFS